MKSKEMDKAKDGMRHGGKDMKLAIIVSLLKKKSKKEVKREKEEDSED